MHIEYMENAPNITCAITFVDIDVSGQYASSLAMHITLSTTTNMAPIALALRSRAVFLHQMPIHSPAIVDDRTKSEVDIRISRLIIPYNGLFEVVIFVRDAVREYDVVIAKVQVSNRGRIPRLSTRYSPILLLSQGRSGSTAMMSALSRHPNVIVPGRYPFEFRQASYLIHALNILTAPACHSLFSPDSFEAYSPTKIGYNPYVHRTLASVHLNSQTTDWQDLTWPHELAALIESAIDRYLDAVSAVDDRSLFYFAEKINFSSLLNVYDNVFGLARKIILVRDFRDVYVSAKIFNSRRGSLGFGRDQFSNDIDWLKSMSHGAQVVAEHCREIDGRSILVRYEDFVASPRETLIRVFAAFDLDSSDDILNVVLAALTDESGISLAHSTSDSASKSIGRWRSELSDAELVAADEALGSFLQELGYDR